MSKGIPNFKDLVDKMEVHRANLKIVERDQIKETLKGLKGVYIFLENDEDVYVGKTDNFIRRLLQHSNERSKNNDANLAFKIAKLEWLESRLEEEKNGKKRINRKKLELKPEFIEMFTRAKLNVNQMKMKYVYIDDPYEQYLFEFYAALHFKTKYNEFRNT